MVLVTVLLILVGMLMVVMLVVVMLMMVVGFVTMALMRMVLVSMVLVTVVLMEVVLMEVVLAEIVMRMHRFAAIERIFDELRPGRMQSGFVVGFGVAVLGQLVLAGRRFRDRRGGASAPSTMSLWTRSP